MKLMTWSLRRPSNATFSNYYNLPSNEPWYSKNYVLVNKEAPKSWNEGQRSFVEQIENNSNKFYAIGMHEFYVCDDGTIANMGYNQVTYPNGYLGYDQTKLVLNSSETDIERPVTTSLRYLMLNYPKIRWGIQLLCTKNASGDRVSPLLNNSTNQNNFIRQAKKIVEIYKSRGFPIYDVEIDFEGTGLPTSYAELFKNLLVRIKNEVCIPTETDLRINLLSLTGDFTPNYYGWHDYRTLASGRDKFGRQAVDEFQLMTYDFSWGGSAPGPSTPLWWLKNVLDYVKDALPVEKTYIGNAGYGRRWPLSERRMGVTFDYKNLIKAQNGMYVHNNGATSSDGSFYFRNQDFIPFASFNDLDSDYAVTYLHVYDLFKARLGEREGNVTGEKGTNYVTSYSSRQKPKITGIQAHINTPSSIEGNVNYNTQTKTHDPLIATVENREYKFYTSSKGKWFLDLGLIDLEGNIVPSTETCVPENGPTGMNGSLSYNFSLSRSGSYKVLAIVGFPFFGNDNFTVNINGSSHEVGGNIPEWYPYITNPAYHYWDCGTYNLSSNNTINIGLTNGAQIGGFIICENYEEYQTGGSVTFPTNLQKMKKRGSKRADGTSNIIDAEFPNEMILTGELLRRPPRPAIIWEDMFGPHLNGEGFSEETDLTNFVYYLRAKSQSYSSGSGENKHEIGELKYCIDTLRSVGYSKGVWNVKKSGIDSAHITSDLQSEYGQLVLNKAFSSNIHVELDMRVDKSDYNARYGIRLISEVGNPSTGQAFRLNFITKQVEFYDFDNTSNSRFINMSTSLSNSLGSRFTLKLSKVGNRIICKVGDRTYFDFIRNYYQPIAYGAYGTQCTPKIYRLNISSLDRFEPMEKVKIHVDNQVYTFGEIQRNVNYDEFGYIIYTGLPGNLTEAVKAIPSEAEMDSTNPSQVEGRIGTIFETEIVPESWNLDYLNLQLATISSWIGKKDVKIELEDSGIWFKTFYVGDKEGYSVAYNSDKIAFIKTAQMVLEYGCKGLAMWTLGQEDPAVVDYIPEAIDK